MSEEKYDYDEIAENIFAPIYPDIAKAIIERTGKTCGRLLDAGCGGGHLGFAVMALGSFQAVFCDINPEAAKIATNRAKSLGLDDRVLVLTADVHELPLTDESFDLIISRGSMPFWDDQEKAFSELYRLLAPGGYAYIGGGLGGAKHQARIHEQMRSGECGFRCFDRKNSKALKTEVYISMFEAWGSPYQVIDNPEEGRWFMFGKAERQ